MHRKEAAALRALPPMFREEVEEEVGGPMSPYQNWPAPEFKQHSRCTFTGVCQLTQENDVHTHWRIHWSVPAAIKYWVFVLPHDRCSFLLHFDHGARIPSSYLHILVTPVAPGCPFLMGNMDVYVLT